MSEEQLVQENVDKVQGLSTALVRLLGEEFPDERPDIAILGLLDAGVKLVRMFNPKGDSVEACDALLDILRQVRDGEAKAIPCNQSGCTEKAFAWYVWPTDGERKYSCAKHTQKAIETAYVLGFAVKANRLIAIEGEGSPESMGG